MNNIKIVAINTLQAEVKRMVEADKPETEKAYIVVNGLAVEIDTIAVDNINAVEQLLEVVKHTFDERQELTASLNKQVSPAVTCESMRHD